jgi:hypothetical protein
METFYIIVITFVSCSCVMITTCIGMGLCIKKMYETKKNVPQENLDNDV